MMMTQQQTPPATSSLHTYSSGVDTLENEGAYAVMAAASQLEAQTGRSVVHLEIGQPGFPTPDHISETGINSIRDGNTKYSSPRGINPLRQSIAKWLDQNRRLPWVTADNIVIGPGAKPGLFFTALALIRGSHDRVIIPDPGFPTYDAMVAVAGGTAVPVPLRKDMRSFNMDILKKEINKGGIRMLVLNSPGNPTGGVIPEDDLKEIAELSKKHDFWVLSDEIYSQLCYEDGYTSIVELDGMRDRTVVVDGFSKSYCMTGWRLGWAVMPKELANRVELLMVHSVGCTATFTQQAGLQAIENGEEDVEFLRKVYRKRRDLVVEWLNKIPGVRCETPQGAFYAFADISEFGTSSKKIADLLLNEGFVAVLPGTDFGKAGEGYIRLSYVSDEETLKEGLKRIEQTLGKLKKVNN